MQNESGHPDRSPVRVWEKIVEQGVLREIREDLVAKDSGPQYIWQERVQSSSKETETVKG